MSFVIFTRKKDMNMDLNQRTHRQGSRRGNGKYVAVRTVAMVLIASFLFGLAPLQSQSVTKAGTVAAPFLKIAAGTRGPAMGEAYIASANDLSSIYWNPGGLAWVQGNQVYFSYTDWIHDFQHNFAAASLNIGGLGTIGISVISLTAPDQEVTTIEFPNGTGEYFSFQNLMLGVTYSRKLTDRFSFGVTGKFISETIYRLNASAFAVDIGTLYLIPGTNLRLGMSLTNFGTKMQFGGDNLERQIDIDPSMPGKTDRVTGYLKTERWDLPLNFKVGFAYDFRAGENVRLTVGADAVTPNDNREYLNTGGELAYNEFLFVRFGFRGYNIDNSEGGFSYGGGIDLPIGSNIRAVVDYAYTDYGRLNAVHRFGIGMQF
jgi:opacity protein-like surface antigen